MQNAEGSQANEQCPIAKLNMDLRFLCSISSMIPFINPPFSLIEN
jgi:hypothetical protein